MARRDRRDQPDSWHHVINRGIARRPLFEDRADIRFFLSRLAREVRGGRLEVHAWCVLTTHFHLLVRSLKGELSEALRRAQNLHSRTFNRRRRRDGTLVRGRFLSKPVETLAYRRTLVRYIDANAVTAGLAAVSWRYPWCSAAQYVTRSGPPWLERSWIESEVAARAGREGYRPEDYAGAFGGGAGSAAALVEARLRLGAGPDALDDLVGAAPERVREWMTRKARLADGTVAGLPVCDGQSVVAAVAELRAAEGAWDLSPRGRRRDGWALLTVGLLRELAGLRWSEVARLTGRSTTGGGRDHAHHVELVPSDAGYADRATRVTVRALELCHGVAPALGSSRPAARIATRSPQPIERRLDAPVAEAPRPPSEAGGGSEAAVVGAAPYDRVDSGSGGGPGKRWSVVRLGTTGRRGRR